MAFWEINNVSIRGVAGCVPDNYITTYDIDLFTGDEANAFNKSVGIEGRNWATEGICASDMCEVAAEKLIAELGWDKSEIDMLIFESVTPDYRTPPTSCILQDKLGLPNSCFALDIPMGCCGFLYGMIVAGNLMSAGTMKRAILMVGDTATRMGSMYDKSRLPLFGDAGVAVALEYSTDSERIVVSINTDGKGKNALITPHSGFRCPVTPESFEYKDFGNGIKRAPVHTLIEGMDVFSFAVNKGPKGIEELLEKCQLDRHNDIDYFLIHQANKMINDRVVRKLNIDKSKYISNLQYFGNTGGASTPLMMVTNLREELQSSKKSLLFSAFGLGLTWGAMHLYTDHIIVPELIKLPVTK